jgi:hypothetical protein
MVLLASVGLLAACQQIGGLDGLSFSDPTGPARPDGGAAASGSAGTGADAGAAGSGGATGGASSTGGSATGGASGTGGGPPVCTTPPCANGQPCVSSNVCASGACLNGVCGPPNYLFYDDFESGDFSAGWLDVTHSADGVATCNSGDAAHGNVAASFEVTPSGPSDHWANAIKQFGTAYSALNVRIYFKLVSAVFGTTECTPVLSLKSDDDSNVLAACIILEGTKNVWGVSWNGMSDLEVSDQEVVAGTWIAVEVRHTASGYVLLIDDKIAVQGTLSLSKVRSFEAGVVWTGVAFTCRMDQVAAATTPIGL